MGKKILFVDDSTSMQQIVSAAITGAGYEVTTAGDGKEGVEKINHDTFDAIITDLYMPNMDGIEFLKEIKQNAKNKSADVIMLSTESSEAMKQQAKDAGAKAWIVKPFKSDQLLKILQDLLD